MGWERVVMARAREGWGGGGGGADAAASPASRTHATPPPTPLASPHPPSPNLLHCTYNNGSSSATASEAASGLACKSSFITRSNTLRQSLRSSTSGDHTSATACPSGTLILHSPALHATRHDKFASSHDTASAVATPRQQHSSDRVLRPYSDTSRQPQSLLIHPG